MNLSRRGAIGPSPTANGVRYGYRRVYALLDRKGWGINIKKVYCIYKELGMQLKNKTPERRVKAKLRDDRAEATCLNDVWAME